MTLVGLSAAAAQIWQATVPARRRTPWFSQGRTGSRSADEDEHFGELRVVVADRRPSVLEGRDDR
jgi:hypothetical protein